MGRVKLKKGRRHPDVGPRLRVALATYPESSAKGVSLRRDVRLTKAAILYADEVDLVSPGTEMLLAAATLAVGIEADPFGVLAQFDDDVLLALNDGVALPEGWRGMGEMLLNSTDQDWLALAEALPAEAADQVHEVRELANAFRRSFDEQMPVLLSNVEEMLQSAGALELVPALASEVVRVAPVVAVGDDMSSEAVTRRYVSKLQGLVRSSKISLLLDDGAAGLVRSMVAEGIVAPSRLALDRASGAAAGAGFVARLPSFDMAPMDEVLDLRQDLTAPLGRYRKAVADIGNRLHGEPFGRDTQDALDHLYINEVRPAISDLQEGFAEHSLVREIGRQVSLDVKAMVTAAAGPVISVGIGSVAELDGWVSALAAVVPGAAAGIAATSRAVNERGAARRELRRSGLFYLYEVDRRLER